MKSSSTGVNQYQPREQSLWGQHGAHMGPVGPRWAPCWPHEPCYQGSHAVWVVISIYLMTSLDNPHTIVRSLPAVITGYLWPDNIISSYNQSAQGPAKGLVCVSGCKCFSVHIYIYMNYSLWTAQYQFPINFISCMNITYHCPGNEKFSIFI